MAEDLAAADVEAFTGGRLVASNAETTRLLDAALTLVRQRCGWHVSPVKTDVVFTLDGTGGRELLLRTRKITRVASVVDDGVALDVSTDVVVPNEYPWKLVRTTGQWSRQYGGVVATIDHGFTAAEAASWRQAVLTVVVNLSSSGFSGRSDAELVSKQIDDVAYQWGSAVADSALLSVDHILSSYDLKWMFV